MMSFVDWTANHECHLVLACSSEQFSPELVQRERQRRQEEAHATHLQRAADLRAGEDLRADKVPGRPGASQAGLRARHD